MPATALPSVLRARLGVVTPQVPRGITTAVELSYGPDHSAGAGDAVDTLFTIIQQFGRGGNVVALFAGTLGVFTFVERMSSQRARADFSRYLISTDFVGASLHLPEGTGALFNRVFGSRHFSLRCLVRSIICSIGATTALFGLSILNDPHLLSRLTDPFEVRVLEFWVVWCLVPDYFNLFKTRMILGLLITRRVKRL